MAGENVVKILVTADSDAPETFGETSASAEEMAAKVDASMADYEAALGKAAASQAEFDEAQKAQADAAAEVTRVQGDETASADELAAAQDRLTGASLASADARKALADSEADVATMTKTASDEQVEAGLKSDESAGMFAGAGGKMKMAALGVAVGLGLAVKGAADFQQQTTRLVTSAGESAKNLGMVQHGILALSSATNTSTSQLASGMYMVESAGFHGAAGLEVLKAAAQGAQAEGADLADVSNAVTSGLNAYGMKASQATSFTNQMVTAVGRGKMTMQDLASSLSAVLPVAASAKISFAQVGGAVATMTGMGMSARQATQDLAFAIRSLLHPSGAASQEMRAMGVNALQVQKNLGKQGLTGTIAGLSDAVLKNTKGGDVLLGYMHSMTPAAAGLARQILAGTISTKQLRTAVYSLNPEQAKLISLFETSATSATGLKQSYAGAMAAMMGGATGLNDALMLTGKHTATFNANVKAIAASAKGAGSNVKGWAHIQGEANFQIGAAVKAIEAMGDSLGLALLPSVTAVLKPLTSFFELIAKNKAASIAFAVVVGGLLAGALGSKLAGAFGDVRSGVEGFASGIQMLLAKLGLMTAATDAQAAATEGATGAQEGLDVAMDANPIGIIILAVAALAVAFVELWKHCAAFRDFWKGLWKDIEQIAGAALGWLKAQLAVFTAFWKSHGQEIEEVARAVWSVIHTIITIYWTMTVAEIKVGLDILKIIWGVAWAVIRDLVRTTWSLISQDIHMAIQFVTGIIGIGLDLITGHWSKAGHDLETLTSEMFHDVISIIKTAVSGFGDLLFDAGKALIGGLIHGISSMIGSVGSAIGSIAHEITSHLPFSPAKKGPLSGSGSPDIAGRKIAQMLSQGMVSDLSGISAASSQMTGAVHLGAAGMRGYGTAGGGALTLEVTGGGSGLDELFITWLKEKVRVKGGGGNYSVQKALGSGNFPRGTG
jgi:hypothetical protein